MDGGRPLEGAAATVTKVDRPSGGGVPTTSNGPSARTMMGGRTVQIPEVLSVLRRRLHSEPLRAWWQKARRGAGRLDVYDGAFLVAVVALYVVVYGTVTAGSGVLGADNGNYLVTMRKVFGDNATGLGLLRPPLIAFPLKIATSVFPVVTATKVLAVLAWLAVGFPMYRLTRTLLREVPLAGPLAVVGGVGYMLSSGFASMLVWGWLTFLGIALIPVIAILLLKSSDGGSWKLAVLLGAVLAILAGAHQVGAIVVAAWLLSYALALLVWRQWKPLTLLLKSGIFAAVFSLWLLPIYLSMPTGTAERFTSYRLEEWGAAWTRISFFYRDPDVTFWLALLSIAVVGVGLLAIDKRRPAARLQALTMGSMLGVWLLLSATTNPLATRTLYYAYLPMWAMAAFTLAVVIRRVIAAVGPQRTLVTGAVLGSLATSVLVLLSNDFRDRLTVAIDFYQMIEDRHVEAAEYISDTTPEDARFVAYPFAFGWWIEGAAGRDAFEIGRFGGRVQNEQSAVAEHVLVGNHSIANGVVLAGYSYPDRLPGTPQFWVAVPEGERYPHMYLDDGATTVAYVDHAQVGMEATLHDLSRKLRVVQAPDSIGVEKRFQGRGLSVEQNITLRPGRFGWTIEYAFEGTPNVIESISLPIVFENLVSLEPMEGTEGIRLGHRLLEHTGKEYLFDTTVTVTGRNVEVTLREGKRSPLGARGSFSGTVVATLLPHQREFHLSMDVVVRTVTSATGSRSGAELAGATSETLEYQRARTLVEDYEISHVAVAQPALPRIHPVSTATKERLDNGPAFEVLRARDGVAIYGIRRDLFESTPTGNSPELVRRVELGPLDELGMWSGSRAAGFRVQLGVGESVKHGIQASVQLLPERWSGVSFTPKQAIDWVDLESMLARLSWQPLEGIEKLGLVLEDVGGRRWSWHVGDPSSGAGEGGWQYWELPKEQAVRKDVGFEWDRVARVNFNAFGGKNTGAADLNIAVAFIGALLSNGSRDDGS